MGYDHYAHSWDWAYEARRMRWMPWRWEVIKYNRIDNAQAHIKIGTVYVSNLTKLAADGYVKLLSEV